MNIVDQVASMLTDDPDVLLELDAKMNTPMTSAQNVVDTTTTPADAEQLMQKSTDDKDLITNRNRTARDLEKKQDKQRAQLLSPQMRQLQQVLDKMQTGVNQNQKDTTDVRDQTNELDQELGNVTQLVRQFEKNLL